MQEKHPKPSSNDDSLNWKKAAREFHELQELSAARRQKAVEDRERIRRINLAEKTSAQSNPATKRILRYAKILAAPAVAAVAALAISVSGGETGPDVAVKPLPKTPQTHSQDRTQPDKKDYSSAEKPKRKQVRPTTARPNKLIYRKPSNPSVLPQPNSSTFPNNNTPVPEIQSPSPSRHTNHNHGQETDSSGGASYPTVATNTGGTPANFSKQLPKSSESGGAVSDATHADNFPQPSTTGSGGAQAR